MDREGLPLCSLSSFKYEPASSFVGSFVFWIRDDSLEEISSGLSQRVSVDSQYKV